jgi:hypothetical protein
MARASTTDAYLRQRDGAGVASIRRPQRSCPKINRKPDHLRQKRHSQPAAVRNKHLSSGIMVDFGDNVIKEIVAFRAQDWRANAGLSIGRAPCRR